jgi:hypothetical protein
MKNRAIAKLLIRIVGGEGSMTVAWASMTRTMPIPLDKSIQISRFRTSVLSDMF